MTKILDWIADRSEPIFVAWGVACCLALAGYVAWAISQLI